MHGQTKNSKSSNFDLLPLSRFGQYRATILADRHNILAARPTILAYRPTILAVRPTIPATLLPATLLPTIAWLLVFILTIGFYTDFIMTFLKEFEIS